MDFNKEGKRLDSRWSLPRAPLRGGNDRIKTDCFAEFTLSVA